MSLQKKNSFELPDLTDVPSIYPFIDELVDTLCTEETKSLIKKNIETESDKQTFMMFVFMYFAVELKFMDVEGISEEDHKKGIKYIMSDIIKNPEKRKMCIELFGKRFNNLFLTN